MIVATAAMCLALTIYHEARSEQIPGQYAVAQVLMHRAEQDPKKVCAESFRAKQFSWANTGVVRVKGGWQIAGRHIPRDQYAWFKAKRIAEVVLTWKIGDFAQGARYYHTVSVKPTWRLSMVKTHRMGRHIFYRQA